MKQLRYVIFIASCAGILGLVGYVLLLRLSVPDMTDMRFALTYWYYEAAVLVLLVIAGISNPRPPRRRF